MNSSESTKRKRIKLIELMLNINCTLIEIDDDHTIGLIRMAIRKGAYERKPYDVTDLARATGFPRTTVLRHLARLRKEGLVTSVRAGRRTIPILMPAASDKDTDAFYTKVERLVRDAASDVSKMDSSVAGQSQRITKQVPDRP